MKIVYNNIIPFKGFKAMAVWPFVFVRKSARITTTDINHEKIHCAQQCEVTVTTLILGIIFALAGVFCVWWVLVSPIIYYVLYGLDFVIRLFTCWMNGHKAYRNIIFEQEAYVNQTNKEYLKKRKPFDYVKYIGKSTYL